MIEPVEILSEVKCDSRELETNISHLGEIAKVPAYVPRYTTYHNIVATGKYGIAPGELHAPSCLAIHEDTHQIFIANRFNNTVEVFSETGEFHNQLGVGQLSEPHGLAIHGDNIYVSCMGDVCDTVNKFSLTEMCLVRSIGSDGSNDEHLNYFNQLTTDPIGRVFIADQSNNRICIHDPDLSHLRNITHQSISLPFNVKVSRDRLYVLCPYNNPCMLVLTLEGDIVTLPYYLWRRNGCVRPFLLLFGSSQQLYHQRLRFSLNSCLLSRRQSPTHDRKRGRPTKNVPVS